MLNDELNERLERMNEENALMKTHHDVTQKMEYNHMKVRIFLKSKLTFNLQQVHDLRLQHQKMQHDMEIKAQKVHMQQLEQDMR